MPAPWDRAENAVENRGSGAQHARPIAAEIAALQAQLAEDDGGVYEDPQTGRCFILLRPLGRTKTTTRRRAPDGGRLHTRDEALIAKGQWEAQMATGSWPSGASAS